MSIAYRPSNIVANGTAEIWRDGYKAAMARVETCLLLGDVDWICREVAAALAESRGRPSTRERPR